MDCVDGEEGKKSIGRRTSSGMVDGEEEKKKGVVGTGSLIVNGVIGFPGNICEILGRAGGLGIAGVQWGAGESEN